MTAIGLLLRVFLALCFLRAGVLKMLDLEDFHLAVRNYGLVPQRFLHTVALAVPLLEIGCASLLLVGFGTGPVAALLVLLLGVFSVAISINLLRGRTFSCGN
jgi:uncharacterized membrane protein YphA (DoxX/SURF4 family)